MGYTLRTGITTGRIDCDLGSFEIQDSTLECDDYETARLLVRSQQYGVSWPDGDPGPPEDGSDSDEADAESEEQEPEAEAEAEDESEPSDESDEEEAEDEDDEESETYTCAGMDGECTRRVDEPGGLCWQHEDQD